MSQAIDIQVLGRYFDRVATADDRAAVETWLQEDPVRRDMLVQLEHAWRADAERIAAPPDADAVWARLARQLDLADAEQVAASPRVLRLVPSRPVGRPLFRAVKWAAAILGITTVGAAGWYVSRGTTPRHVAGSEIREYVTPRGQRASFRLADGSEVVLNSGSRLRVPATLGRAGLPRTVELEGQGYFTVVRDPLRPFRVRTARGVTRDLSTRFDISAYPDDAFERIVVTDGEVAVRVGRDSSMPEVPLIEGQMATITKDGSIAMTPADIDREIAWTVGHVELQDVTLADAARRLSRWYDLDIRIADRSLQHRRLSGSYADEPIADILTVLTASIGARYEWNDRTVTIFSVERR